MVGVILAQMKGGQATLLNMKPDAFLGIAATLCIATLSGFAAVYTERVLKRGQLRAHSHAQDILGYMQIQMAVASLLIIGVFAIASDLPTIVEVGIWHGFDRAAVIAVFSSAVGGLIVSAVLKYADSVLKGYATAASVILTGLLSSMLLGTSLDLHFVLAVVNVTCSIALYSQTGGGHAGAAVVPPSEKVTSKAAPEMALAVAAGPATSGRLCNA